MPKTKTRPPKKTDQPEPITNWRQAHRAGKIWCRLSINGGKVQLGGQSIGGMRLTGPLNPVQGLIVYMAACGRTLDEIKAFLKKNGYQEPK